MNQDTNNSTPNQPEPDIEIISYSDSQFARDKIEARLRLLAMPPESAQKLVNRTLFPQCWEFRIENQEHIWSESIPRQDGEEDYPY